MFRRHDRSIAPGAEGIEFSREDPTIPVAFRIWRAGVNETDKGPVTFSALSQLEVMRRYRERGMAVVIDYDHESTIPAEERRAAASTGYGIASGRCRLAMRGADLWAEGVQWTDRAKAQIRAEERTQVSPFLATDDRGEIVELVNIALCTEGATHRGVDFAARMRRFDRSMRMQEIIAKLRATLEALQAGGAGSIDEALAQLAALESIASAAEGSASVAEEAVMGEEMKRMGSDMDEMKQAMSRVEALLKVRQPIAAQALSRAPVPNADVVAMRREHVGVILEKAPEGVVSSDDSRWLTERADPDLAKRVVNMGVRLSRERPASGAGTPGGGAASPEDFGLNDIEKATARKHNLTYEAFARQKDQNSKIKQLRSQRPGGK